MSHLNTVFDFSRTDLVFDPGPDVLPENITRYSPSKGTTKFLNNNDSLDTTAFLVTIAGARQNGDQLYANAGYGVYFGTNSPFNRAAPLPSSKIQTSESAKVYATIQAIEFFWKNDLAGEGTGTKRLIIQVDSKHVWDRLTAVNLLWTSTEGLNIHQQDRGNFNMVLALHYLVITVKCTSGIAVLFWHTQSEDNRG